MKKVTGYIDVRALGRCDFDFYVDDNATDEEIEQKVEEACNYYINYDVEEGYEEVTETVTYMRKKNK